MINRIEVINRDRIILHFHGNVYIRHYYNSSLFTICRENNGIMMRYLTIFPDNTNHFTI